MVMAALGVAAVAVPASTASAALPKKIPVTFVGELTGPAGFAGQAQLQGLKWEIKNQNASKKLKGSKLVLTVKDNATNPATTTSLMSEAASSKAVAVFGPMSSSTALPSLPFAQRAKLPVIETTAELPAVLDVGDYIYRTLPVSLHYHPRILDEVVKKAKNKRINFVYFSDNPTDAQLTTKVMPPRVKKVGGSIPTSIGIPTKTTDFGPVISKVMEGDPGAIGLEILGQAGATLIKGLRDAGYKGVIFAHEAAATPDILKGAGSAANGVLTISGFNENAKSAKKFVKAFKRANRGVDSVNQYHAAGVDAVDFLVQSILASGKADRAGIHAGMKKVAKKGFTGRALGAIRFINNGRDATSKGNIVEFNNGKAKVIG
jgi:ABC-type branched-subunit amino acid transport system substrate-binding protein